MKKAGNVDVKNLEKWLIEAYKLGTREIGLHSGAEPLASNILNILLDFQRRLVMNIPTFQQMEP